MPFFRQEDGFGEVIDALPEPELLVNVGTRNRRPGMAPRLADRGVRPGPVPAPL